MVTLSGIAICSLMVGIRVHALKTCATPWLRRPAKYSGCRNVLLRISMPCCHPLGNWPRNCIERGDKVAASFKDALMELRELENQHADALPEKVRCSCVGETVPTTVCARRGTDSRVGGESGDHLKPPSGAPGLPVGADHRDNVHPRRPATDAPDGWNRSREKCTS